MSSHNHDHHQPDQEDAPHRHNHDQSGQRNHSGHGGHDHHGHGGHGNHADQFRRLFWVSLILSIPVVFFSHMIQDWFSYSLSWFPGDNWVSPILGTVIFIYGGRIFLEGAVS